MGGVLLLGTSTLIGIVLIVDSELEPRKSPQAKSSSGMLRSAIGLSWFMPTLYAVTTPLVYTVVGNWPIYWWMPVNSVGFILFIIIETLFMIIFLLLFLTLIRKSTYLKNHQDKHNISVCKRCVYGIPIPLPMLSINFESQSTSFHSNCRIGIIYRTTCLLVLKLSTDILYLVYLNTNEFIISYAFGASSIFLVCRNCIQFERYPID